MPKCNQIEVMDNNQEQECGRPAWTNSNELCEKHFQAFYPLVYDRIKPEIKCPECSNNPVNHCPVCHNRKWVNPHK